MYCVVYTWQNATHCREYKYMQWSLWNR